ncbi:ethanolamine kinase 2, partial [Asbolus verrucosus]
VDMEDLKTTPHISVTINDKDISGGALEILRVIRPGWKPQDIEFKLLTDGITNKLVGCRSKDVDVAETVLVRVYGNKTDLLIDRKAETRNILLLSKIGLAPDLYATFQNGLAYQFVPGCTLTDATVKQPEVYKLIATRMAKLHKVQVPGEKNPEPFIWDKLQSFLNLVPDNFSDINKNNRYQEIGTPKSKIQEEIHYLRRFLSDLKSPVVFCHNDLLLGNVIYTKEKGCVTFIDFEYAAHNYQAFDIANHFLEYAGVEEVDYSKYPNKEMQIDWFKIYLTEYKEVFTQDDVDRLYVQVSKFTLVSHLFWGIWALIQAEHSYIDFDFLGLVPRFFKFVF